MDRNVDKVYVGLEIRLGKIQEDVNKIYKVLKEVV